MEDVFYVIDPMTLLALNNEDSKYYLGVCLYRKPAKIHFLRANASITQYFQMIRIMRKKNYCLCENKGVDQLCSNCTAVQRLCFRYTDSAIHLLPKSEISSFKPFSEVQAGLCRTWSKTPKTGFLASRFKLSHNVAVP